VALRNVLKDEDPILRKKSREVKEVTERIKTTMKDLVETMRFYRGVGLAAPQVGTLRRMFVAEPSPGEVYYMINPEIIEEEGAVSDTEGCLSIPDYYGTVERPEKVRISALDMNGEQKEYTFEGFAARVMCHETDHLDGILYSDKAVEMHTVDQELERLNQKVKEEDKERIKEEKEQAKQAKKAAKAAKEAEKAAEAAEEE